MHVLIVEDDAILGEFVARLLRFDGHDAAVVGDGDAAIAYLEAGRPELMILDLGLPGRDGIEVLATTRERFPATSVLVLTGRAEQGHVDGKVRCLKLGADDIMLKPFSAGELVARCQAILRRRERYADPMLRHGDLTMDRMTRRVTQSRRDVDLTTTEFSLLESLMRRGGGCCSRAELMREVWPTAEQAPGASPTVEAASNILEVYINYLRKKLGQGRREAEMAGSSMVRTVRGEGYRLTISEKTLPPQIPPGRTNYGKGQVLHG